MKIDSSSPCKNQCLMDNRLGFCVECGRTTEEIANWTSYSNTYKQYVKTNAARRLKEKKC